MRPAAAGLISGMAGIAVGALSWLVAFTLGSIAAGFLLMKGVMDQEVAGDAGGVIFVAVAILALAFGGWSGIVIYRKLTR